MSKDTYQKINTLYKRDEHGIIMLDSEFSDPTFEYLRGLKWTATEKIDGTNILIALKSTTSESGVVWGLEYKGKTDRAQIPGSLLQYLGTNYPEEKVLAAFGLKKTMTAEDCIAKGWVDEALNFDPSKVPDSYRIYGEGYGKGIQKVGPRYIKDGVSFIGFDIKVGEWWLLSDTANPIFEALGCPVVPYIGDFTIDEAVEYVKSGFKSRISEDKELMAEGLVMKTPIGLRDRNGKRIIVKIKTCDYEKYKRKYGE